MSLAMLGLDAYDLSIPAHKYCDAYATILLATGEQPGGGETIVRAGLSHLPDHVISEIEHEASPLRALIDQRAAPIVRRMKRPSDAPRKRTLKTKDIRAIVAKSNGHCWYCGDLLLAGNCHIDHMIPTHSGGTDEDDNLVGACRTCNLVKGHRDMEHFRNLMARRSMGRPVFTDEQIAYLSTLGIDLPELPRYEFWFEVNHVNSAH